MELKDECLIDFWIWYLQPKQRKTYKTNSIRGSESGIKIRFLAMSFSERWGVLQDYFDSVGVDINIKRFRQTGRFFYTIFDDVYQSYQDTLNSRPEARTAAIEKAVEIRNEQLK